VRSPEGRPFPGELHAAPEAVVARIVADPCTSDWLRGALQAALRRDPVDAANDAEVLAKVLSARSREILGEGRTV
jgi:hypothetical protein